MRHFYLMNIGCFTAGIILTRFATSMPSFLESLFNLLSIGLFVAPIVYDLYMQHTTTQNHTQIHKWLWQLPLVCATYFMMLLGIKWLQGTTELLKNTTDTIATLNMAVILTAIFYAYLAYLPRIWPIHQNKNQQ